MLAIRAFLVKKPLLLCTLEFDTIYVLTLEGWSVLKCMYDHCTTVLAYYL